MKNKTFKIRKIMLTAFIASSLYSIPSSIAANQGTLDPTSSGDFEVSVVIPDRVRITGMQDIAFGKYLIGDFNEDFPVCVYTNTASAQYGVTASGDGTSSALTLTNATDIINYHVYWNDVAGSTTGEIELLATVLNDNIENPNQESSTCVTGGNSANLHVRILNADMRNISNGTYSGTLTITIDPS